MVDSILKSIDYDLQQTEKILNKLKDDLDSQRHIQLPNDLAQTVSDLCEKLPTLPKEQAQNFARRLEPLLVIFDEISEHLRSYNSAQRVGKLVSNHDAVRRYQSAQTTRRKT